MDKENMVYTHSGIFLNHKEKWSYVVWKKLGTTEDNHIKQIKSDS